MGFWEVVRKLLGSWYETISIDVLISVDVSISKYTSAGLVGW